MDRQYSELNMWRKKLQRSGERARRDVRRGQEGYKATRLEKYTETRHIFRKDTKFIAVVEEMKLIVRHDLVLRNPAYQKVHHV